MVELRKLGFVISQATAPYEDSQSAVISRARTSPPPSNAVSVGARYIVPMNATGAWAGQTHRIATRKSSGWEFTPVVAGMTAWVRDENKELVFNGSEWGSDGLGSNSRGILTPINRDMPGRRTYADGDRACDVALAVTPVPGTVINPYLNGQLIASVGNGTKLHSWCYFSGDGGFTPRTYAALKAGDCIYWNGNQAGYQISETDVWDFLFEVA